LIIDPPVFKDYYEAYDVVSNIIQEPDIKWFINDKLNIPDPEPEL
jgi:hypothetical protein